MDDMLEMDRFGLDEDDFDKPRLSKRERIDKKIRELKIGEDDDDMKDDIKFTRKKKKIDKKLKKEKIDIKLFKMGIYPELNNLNSLLVNLNNKEKRELFTMIKNHYLYNTPDLKNYLETVEINNLKNIVNFILNLDHLCSNNKKLVKATLKKLNKLNKNLLKTTSEDNTFCQVRKRSGKRKKNDNYYCQIRKKPNKKKIKKEKQKKNKQKQMKKQNKKQKKKQQKKKQQESKSWFNIF